MKNIRIFYLKIFPFLVVKFSVYLKRRVFVMIWVFCACSKAFFGLTRNKCTMYDLYSTKKPEILIPKYGVTFYNLHTGDFWQLLRLQNYPLLILGGDPLKRKNKSGRNKRCKIAAWNILSLFRMNYEKNYSNITRSLYHRLKRAFIFTCWLLATAAFTKISVNDLSRWSFGKIEKKKTGTKLKIQDSSSVWFKSIQYE